MLARLLVALVPVALVVGWALPAAAQSNTITVFPETFDRDQEPLRPETQGPNWISHSDCVADDKIRLTVNFSQPTSGGVVFQAWVGLNVDCSQIEQRDGASSTCWQVFAGTPQGLGIQVEMRAQDIVARNRMRDPGNTGPGSGTAADCEESAWPTDPTEITIHFMMVTADGNVHPDWGIGQFTTSVDVHGPPPPEGVKAGVGESKIILDWAEGSAATDVAGYNFYCVAMGATAPANTPQVHLEDGSVDAGHEEDASVGAGGSTSLEGGAGTTGTGGTGATGGSAEGGIINRACPTNALVPGELPDESLLCGKVTGQFISGGEATDVTNFTRYAVAVAGRDTVQNVGPLSRVVCGEPQIVDDFFERYRAAGGKGGGGFCSFGARPAPGALLVALGAALALALRRRRWPLGVR